jgi:hypothetical protein
LSTLEAITMGAPQYEPMQAFTFQSNLAGEELACAAMPPSGMLIQTPDGVGEINFLINEVNIRIGSTVFFETKGYEMIVSTFEGKAVLEVASNKSVAFAGTQVRVELDENMMPTGVMYGPEPLNAALLDVLPFGLLPDQFDPMPPLSDEAIEALVEAQPWLVDLNGDGVADHPSANGNGATKCEDGSPGQSCDAPGQGGSTPGNSENATGQPSPGTGQGQDASAKENQGKKPSDPGSKGQGKGK